MVESHAVHSKLISIDPGADTGSSALGEKLYEDAEVFRHLHSKPLLREDRIEDDAFKHPSLLQSVHRCARLFDLPSDISNGEIHLHSSLFGQMAA